MKNFYFLFSLLLAQMAMAVKPSFNAANNLAFVQNMGQIITDKNTPANMVHFKASVNGLEFYLTDSGITYVFVKHNRDLYDAGLGGSPDPNFKPTTEYGRIDMNLKNAVLNKNTVVKEKLNEFLFSLKQEIGNISGRAFVDSAPVMDKVWAAKSGLGWVGKNSNLINKEKGSFFFIAELIIDVELETDGPIKDYCGTCTKCIDACPTEAIVAPYIVDGSKCISYLTIELKENIPTEFKDKMDGWAFGCDVCQDVCPWNSFSMPHNEAQFKNTNGLLNYTEAEWNDITEETFNFIFKNSAVKRTKYKGLKRNLMFLKKHS